MGKYQSRLYYHQSGSKSIYHKSMKPENIYVPEIILLVDGIRLLNSGKTMLGSNFFSKLKKYFGKSDNFLRDFMT